MVFMYGTKITILLSFFPLMFVNSSAATNAPAALISNTSEVILSLTFLGAEQPVVDSIQVLKMEFVIDDVVCVHVQR